MGEPAACLDQERHLDSFFQGRPKRDLFLEVLEDARSRAKGSRISFL